MFFVWLVILASHLRFRRAVARDRLMRLPMRLWAHPILTLAGMVLLIAISVTTFFVDGLQWSLPAFAIFLGFITLLYFRNRERKVAV
jgi:amino acid transporter, AAT family